MNGGKINKIFEIGLPKTGTTSLGMAYEILGFKKRGWNHRIYDLWKEKGMDYLFPIIDNATAFQDGPWHDCDYKILDQRYPNSKFIILERNNEDWLRSKEMHFSPIYNVNNIRPKYFEWRWATDRNRHIEEQMCIKENKYNEIKEYFKDRPNDLLVMNVCAGEGWEILCPFLDCEIPNEPFPYRNKSKK